MSRSDNPSPEAGGLWGWRAARDGEIVPDREALRAAQIDSFVRQSPINAAVTLAVSSIVGVLLWPLAPHWLVAGWVLAQAALALDMLRRWHRIHGRPRPERVGRRALRRAVILSGAAGALWGASVVFLDHVPTAYQTLLIAGVAAMNGGAATTLAPVPRAALAFTLCSIAPYIVAFTLRGDELSLGFATLAVVFVLAMLVASRQVHRDFIGHLRTRHANQLLLDRLESARREWLAVSGTSEGIALYDAQGKLALWNEGFMRTTGLDPEHFRHGADRFELIDAFLRESVGIEDAEERRRWIDERLAMSNSPDARVVQRLADGRWIRSSARRTPSGETVVIHSDITEIKRAEESLRESEERFRTLIEQAQDVILIVDPDGRITYAAPSIERVTGHAPAELVGLPIFDLFHPGDRKQGRRALDEMVSDPSLVQVREVRLRDAEGVYRPFEGMGQNLLDNRLIGGILVNLRDITERREAEDRLRQAQRMEAVGQLTGGIAHDFNNLLSVVMGSLELVEDDVADRPRVAVALARALAATRRGAELTHRLLAFARSQHLSSTPMRIDVLLDELDDLLRTTLGETVAIERRIEAPLWACRSDPAELEAAVLNLAINARDAMPEGGTLTVSARNVHIADHDRPAGWEGPGGDYVMIAVSDTGTGMDPATIRRAYEPFFTTKEVGKGSGLGLSMVYGFVRQCGGQITIDSAVGEGTAVSLYFPRGEEVECPENRPTEKVRSGSGEQVLLVEDETEVRTVATDMLERLGYAVTAAGDAAEAMALIDAGLRHDLLISDVVLPGGTDGVRFAHEAAAKVPNAAVLFISGYTADALESMPDRIEEVALLRKPFAMAELGDAVRRALADRAGVMPAAPAVARQR